MEKYKMYVSIVDQRLFHHPHDSPWEYEIEIPRQYIPIFDKLFDQIYSLELRNFIRSHLPYVPYHYDKDNHDIDQRTKKIYALIHEFTDDESKRFIEQLPYFR